MIERNDVIKIGRLLKTFGIKGEITLLLDKPFFADIDSDYYFLEIDGIFVPFFIEEVTITNDTTLRVKFEDIGDEKQASRYSNISVFLPRKLVEEDASDEMSDDWDSFIGYSVFDQNLRDLGVIEDVDSSTINVLFLIKKNELEWMLPANEDFVMEINDEKKIIHYNLPEGLIE